MAFMSFGLVPVSLFAETDVEHSISLVACVKIIRCNLLHDEYFFNEKLLYTIFVINCFCNLDVLGGYS